MKRWPLQRGVRLLFLLAFAGGFAATLRVEADDDPASSKPLPPGWWHLSLEEIRAGEASEAGNGADAESLPAFDLREWARERQLERATSDKQTGEELTRTGSKPDTTADKRATGKTSTSTVPQATAPSGASETPGSSTLRDYTSATTRKLQESGGTNSMIRPLSPTLSISHRNFNIFNRPPPKEDSSPPRFSPALSPSLPPPSGAATTAAGAKDPTKATGETPLGQDSYPIPESPVDVVKPSSFAPGPLEVVQSSLADPRYAGYVNPYGAVVSPGQAPPAAGVPDEKGSNADVSPFSAMATPVDATATAESLFPKSRLPGSVFPASPFPAAPLTTDLKPALEPGGSTNQARPGTTRPGAAPNTPGGTTGYPAMEPFGQRPPVGAHSPLSPIQPVYRNSGPNADGFYEPKSITDLQYGR